MIINNILKDKISFLNYLFIGSVLLDEIFSAFLGVKGMPAISITLFIITLILYSSEDRSLFWKCLTNPPLLFWLFWCIYSWLNWEIRGIEPQGEVLYRHYLSSFVLPLLTLCIIYFEGSKNLRMITLVVIIYIALYCLFGVFFQERGTGNIADGTTDARGRTVLGNHLPLNAICLTFFVCFAYINRFLNKELFFMLLALTVASIFFFATRKAFGGWIIIVTSLCLTKVDFRKPKNIVIFILFGIILYFVYDFVLHNTLLGARLLLISDDADYVGKWVKIPSYLNFLGDRAAHYVLGWKLFLEHPITGIGIHNFQFYSGYRNRLHSEYMVQLCECGIVGFSLWALFMKGLFVSVRDALKIKAKSVSLVCLGGIVCMLFIDMTAWTYQGAHFFVIYGLILAYCQPIMIKRKWIKRFYLKKSKRI